ncbi:CLUMA_CG001029, isoform A [Clunio marinus]|uniref:CLUMA_CG001029, isoform A n=1 Tax=Clunio marinus TaxID=568069 RepID=A0A1J1HLX4_9DIPT|nr:CLUMA_CG001029, isoform A [Clunio marinus]
MDQTLNETNEQPKSEPRRTLAFARNTIKGNDERNSARSSISSGGENKKEKRITRMFDSISLNKSRRSTYTRPTLRYLPTYQLESENPFNPCIVKDLLKEIVDFYVETNKISKFDQNSIISLCLNLSTEILNRVKAKRYDRYRIISNVTICENRNQSCGQTAAFIWDAESDGMAFYVHENTKFFVVAVVYGIYYD